MFFRRLGQWFPQAAFVAKRKFSAQRSAPLSARGFAVIRWPLGFFLALAAGLKAHGLSRLAFDGSLLLSPQAHVAAIEAEIAIGCLLLWGRYPRLAWLLAISFFALVGGISFYVALTGQRYCPACFGVVRVPSRAMCALDLGIVSLLVVCRPFLPLPRGEREGVRGAIRRTPSFSWRGAATITVGMAVLCVVFFALTSEAALARLRGERISVTPAISDLGDGEAGERRTFEIRLTNHAATPINIFGGAKYCGCDPTSDLPIALEPGESRSITVQMRFGGSAGRFQHSVRLHSDDQAQPVVTARFSGRVSE